MQRLFNLDKWDRLKEGESFEFSNPRARNVRIEVNAPVKTALHVIDEQGEVHFLALVEGRDTIEFGSTGSFQLTVEGSDVLIYTADGADISQKVIAPVIFTKIAERRRRNPELEAIAALMQRNMERRLEQQAHELEQLFARRAEAVTQVSAAPRVPVRPATEPAQAGNAAPPDTSADATNGGSRDGGTTGETSSG